MGEKEKILDTYERKVEKWEAYRQPVADLKDVTIADAMLLVAKLNPTNRQESKEVTKQLLTQLCEMRIATSAEVVEASGISVTTILSRLKILRSMNMVRRESRMYYLATPRLYAFIKIHMQLLD